jgi:flagellar biosynthesis anti-sigma factor FlgM
MKAIISSHSALTTHRRQPAVDAVSVPPPLSGRGGAARATRAASSAEARPAAVAGDPPIDHFKVERLKAALAAGNLKFDSELVAQRLIDRDE